MTNFEYGLHEKALHGVHTMLSNNIKHVPNVTSGATTNSTIAALGSGLSASMAAHPVGWAIGGTIAVVAGAVVVGNYLDSLDD
ncbi:hypothetical protein BGP_1216 [Beggiatoa sp. PS]|nr:hypothetical protein BGP_1216 [Beggiatoa sp. PS]